MAQIVRTPQQIAAAVRRRRRGLGLSQAGLGEQTKLRQATISAIEGGAPGTRLDTLCDIFAALDLEFVVRPRTKAKPAAIEDVF